MKRDDIQAIYDDSVCAVCPWTLDEVNKPRVGMCEGAYCQTAIEKFAEENNLDLE